jgi:hypothetical protein
LTRDGATPIFPCRPLLTIEGLTHSYPTAYFPHIWWLSPFLALF